MNVIFNPYWSLATRGLSADYQYSFCIEEISMSRTADKGVELWSISWCQDEILHCPRGGAHLESHSVWKGNDEEHKKCHLGHKEQENLGIMSLANVSINLPWNSKRGWRLAKTHKTVVKRHVCLKWFECFWRVDVFDWEKKQIRDGRLCSWRSWRSTCSRQSRLTSSN